MYKKAKIWLKSLNSDVTGEGAIHLANLYLSWRENILPSDVICSFMAECHKKKIMSPSKDAILIYRNVASQFCQTGLLSSIRLTDKVSINASTTLTSDNFYQFISDKVKTSPAILPPPPMRSKPKVTADGGIQFREALARITSIPDWYKTEGLSLGAPYPHQTYCWFTDSRPMNRKLNTCPSGKSKGDAARDVLGLVGDVAGLHHRIHVKFKLKFEPKSHSIARPHSLGGNQRFSAYHSATPEAARYYRVKWGSTTDLEQLAAKAPNVAGLPERISAPIPLAKIGPSLSFDYLGPVTTPRNPTPSSNHEYAQRLLAGISVKDAIEQLAALLKP